MQYEKESKHIKESIEGPIEIWRDFASGSVSSSVCNSRETWPESSSPDAKELGLAFDCFTEHNWPGSDALESREVEFKDPAFEIDCLKEFIEQAQMGGLTWEDDPWHGTLDVVGGWCQSSAAQGLLRGCSAGLLSRVV